MDSHSPRRISLHTYRGDSGNFRTYRRLAQSLYWIGMKGTVTNYLAACQICQRNKYQACLPVELLQPLPIPNDVREEVSIDFITNLPKIKGYDVILVVVDRLSKYGHFIPIKHPCTARSLAGIFVKEVVKHHGIPISIVSDKDPIFLSFLWRELF